jgi:TonB family protein
MRLSALLVAPLLISCTLLAQDSDEPSRGPDGGTRVRVEGIKVLPLPGKPFSGRSTTEWTRTLEDGTVVKTHLFAMVARDSQGRIYRERRHFVPSDSTKQSALTHILIYDPTNHTHTECDVHTRVCDVTGYYAPTTFTPPPVGPFRNGTGFLSRESIGNDVIDGIDVVGSRETITLNPGVVGNSQPLVSTREFWYSPDLQVNLALTRKDPREGTQLIRVGDLSRSEPDPALFKIPAGFVVENTASAAEAAQSDSPATSTSGVVASPASVRVSPGVVQGLRVYGPAPSYPEAARQAHIQGQVVLAITVDKNGGVKDVRVASSPSKLLTDPAIAAVSQWRYQPYRLNGTTIEVKSTVVVNFALQAASKSTP